MTAQPSTLVPRALRLAFILAYGACGLTLSAQQYVDTAANPNARRTNDPARVDTFRDRGLGLFIHWSVDGPLGGVISHSLVGASPDYVDRFFRTLPGYFNPDQYQPGSWAALAKLAGFEYVMFTAKHHSGFCMWDTAATSFGVMHKPYGKDITRQLIDAFRKQGIAIGLYFSPDDFFWLHQKGITINRHVKGVYPQDIPAFMDYTKRQLHELLTNYGPIDYFFFDGPAEQLTDYAWQLQPNLVITRGVMETPEQYTPGVALPGAWEGNLTMGTEWPWKATNEVYKSGTELIEILIETRAKGGNLLLNIGPKPDGQIAIEQESRLREIALWNFVNGEAIKNVRPWVITQENGIWFTRRKESGTVYAFLTKMQRWKLGDAKTVTLRSVRATPRTQISVLGQSDEIVEYRPDVKPKTTWTQDDSGLHITAYRAQRLYTDRSWPNPLVLRITNAEPGLTPPQVLTTAADWDPATGAATLHGRLDNLGNVQKVEAGFQYREKKDGTDLSEKIEPWIDLPLIPRTSTGEFTFKLEHLTPRRDYEYRARVRHPLITMYGQEKTFHTPR
ncbi:MAG: alpha-L-fucosidase [Acidobacteria bacterium]|nr:MAG: alpha-L-fucosidase [Acidobacteriota bacterium]